MFRVWVHYREVEVARRSTQMVAKGFSQRQHECVHSSRADNQMKTGQKNSTQKKDDVCYMNDWLLLNKCPQVRDIAPPHAKTHHELWLLNTTQPIPKAR